MATKMGGQCLFQLHQKIYIPSDAYLEKHPKLICRAGNMHFLLFQNQYAEIVHPICYSSLLNKIQDWVEKNDIKGCTLGSFKFHEIPWRFPSRIHTNFPIALYHRRLLPTNSLHHFMSKQKLIYFEKINKETELKSIIFAGFLPRSFYSMIKKFRPGTYKQDINSIRYTLLEANNQVFEWYLNTKQFISRCWDYSSAFKLNHLVADDKTNPRDILEEKFSYFYQQVNVHSNHQDRKKITCLISLCFDFG